MSTTRTAERPPLAGVARVLPWDAMTDAQREEHLRHFHHLRWTAVTAAWLHVTDHTHHSRWTIPHTHDKDPR